ncbi:NADH-quinone oxidoreductase subunit N [Wenjunlia vitaminophila]|uniref:NADH-quinone oxidoreductase subunit N n=1 Tax=Wenjunlia vitaminophila TaxID=76728 RepID=A0A0T6LSV8_WENVI|nr:NADH-quinone oxidoreductase subunit N [Wenjunlia vitaminophila]KRV49194.1 NADH-quinone oxidoreductase subunit N [Wenjunlia vitaminophila]
MNGTDENPLDLLPEVLLAGCAVLALLLGCWLPRHRQWLAGALAVTGCAAGLVAAAVAAAGPTGTAFDASYAVDPVTSTGRIVILGGTLLVLLLSLTSPWLRAAPRETEFYVLVLLAAVGAVLLAGAQDLLLLAAGYLLASVPAYALAGFARDGRGTEAALKYYVLGALLGVLLLTGVTVLLAAGHGTGYPALRRELPDAPVGLVITGGLGVLAGVLFKSGGVPAHYWLPDAVQGSLAPVGAFLTTVPKIGALAAGYRLAAGPLADTGRWWPDLVAVVAVASMTLGNLAAFSQRDVRRLLAYSTISQVGYLLLPVAVAGRTALDQRALLFYLAGYAVTNLGAFAVVCALPRARHLADYRGLARERPALAVALVVCLLGLVGTPPTAVFLGKLAVFSAAFDAGYTWLAVVAAANTVASLFYYLRWIAPTVLGTAPPGDEDRDGDGGRVGNGNAGRAGADPLAGGHATGDATFAGGAVLVAYPAAAASVLLGLLGGPVLDLLAGPLAG